MQNTHLNAGIVAVAMIAVAMLTLVPPKSSKIPRAEAKISERMTTIYKTSHGPSATQLVEAACGQGGCLDI